jgi:hypothetical protein
MSYSKLFLLGAALALFHVDWWKATLTVLAYIAISLLETWNRERRLKKILDNEFDDGWTTYEYDSAIEVKEQIARLKIGSGEDHAVIVRLAQILYRMAVV